MSHECIVISKESFLDEAVEGLGFSAQPPKVKDGTIIAEADIYSLIHVPYCLPQDASEEKVEQNWSKDTALFDPLEMKKGSDCSPLERT